MPRATFNSGDLPAEFFELDRDTQQIVIRIGLEAYTGLGEALRSQVLAEMSEDDAAKAAALRAEGVKTAMESVRGRLAAVDALEAELHVARAANDQLRLSVAAEAAKRAEALVADARKDFEIENAQSIAALKEQIATASAQAETVALLKESNETLREKIAILEAAAAELTAQKTKSSSAIGKAGEATVLEMLQTYILPTFPFATVKDMTTVSHAADFHLWVMKASGIKTKILIDSKKYKRSINTTEIEKLYADVDADTEARGGLMVSLESPISTMAQFQIGYTPKRRPVLFLTFHGIDTPLRAELLIWAVRVLVDASDETGEERDAMMASLQEFLSGLDGSVKSIDAALRGMVKSVESLKEIRDGLVRQITKFRAGGEETEELASTECSFVAKGGLRCSMPAVGGDRCSKHVKRMKKADVINLTE